ncbi:MAG: hypothetical protein KDD77_18350, partial [Caldilineaceae bacterium]|nr:hypothetical protein [Caldilineaceae bacterium]
QLNAPWSDVRSGLFGTIAEWGAKRTLAMPQGRDRAWKPSLLVPVDSARAVRRSYRFLMAITRPNGSIFILGTYGEGDHERTKGLLGYEQIFASEGIFARVALVRSEHFTQALQTTMEVYRSAFFRPNTLFLPVGAEDDEEELQFVLDRAGENQLGVILYMDNPLTGLGREQAINVWLREQSPGWAVGLELSNLDLALLLAYQLARNWRAQINLITVVEDAAEAANGRAFLEQLIDLGRMPRTTQAIVHAGAFDAVLPAAPQADLNIFGVQQRASLGFMQRMVDVTTSTCILVRDSGEESALA